MSIDKTDFSGIYAMLEEIKSDIKKSQQHSTVRVDVDAVNNLANSFHAGIEEMKKPQKVEHRHSFDIRSVRVFLIFCLKGVTLIVLSIILYHKSQTIKMMKDNDLKYRYIQMKGQAASADILMLREVFDYNRNADSVRIIRKRVEKYERLVKEEAERQARARLNAKEAEKLQREAETVKGKK